MSFEAGVVLFDVLSAEPQAQSAPAWVKIAPRGRFTARDGREFEVNPEALAARFRQEGIDLPVDVDHATVRRPVFGETAPAIGWIKELAAKADGLYGRIEWLSEGLRVLAARTHRYISPAFPAGTSGIVSWLHSAALVAAPALPMPAVASAALPSPTTHTLGAHDMGRIVTPALLDAAFKGFNTNYRLGYDAAQSHRDVVAMTTRSETAEEIYGFLGTFPGLREWIGDRHVKGLAASGFSIKNRLFETTVSVKRTEIEDDKTGLYSPIFSEMGRTAKQHPDRVIFELLVAGFSTNGYDGQYFFDTDHAMKAPDGMTTGSISNMQSGSGEPWFLIDGSRAIKPLIWQERTPYEFTTIEDPRNERVFMRDEYTYGVRARCNAGFGLWQLAFGSKATLDSSNLRAAYTAMTKFVDDEGKLLISARRTLLSDRPISSPAAICCWRTPSRAQATPIATWLSSSARRSAKRKTRRAGFDGAQR